MQQRTIWILVGVLAAVLIVAIGIWHFQDRPVPVVTAEDARVSRALTACQSGHDASKEGSVKTDVGAQGNSVAAGATIGSHDKLVLGAGDNISPEERVAENAAIRACVENYLKTVEPAPVVPAPQ